MPRDKISFILTLFAPSSYHRDIAVQIYFIYINIVYINDGTASAGTATTYVTFQLNLAFKYLWTPLYYRRATYSIYII